MRRMHVRWLILIFGFVPLLLLATWSAITIKQVIEQPFAITHHGIIEGKFTDTIQGTTAYHLLVNESGTVTDVQTDSVAWYTDTHIGSPFTWQTKNSQLTAQLVIPLIGLAVSVCVFFGLAAYVHDFLPREEAAS